MAPYEVQGADPDEEDPTQKSVLSKEEQSPGGSCERCATLPEVVVTASRLSGNSSDGIRLDGYWGSSSPFPLQNRDPYDGFLGNLNYFLNGGNENGIHYNRNGEPIGLAPIGGAPDLIGGPLMRGEKIIKIGKYAFNSRFFHRIVKPKILQKGGDFSKIVGNNPDIGLDGINIVLKGAKGGPFQGRSYKTALTIFDFIF